MDTISLLNITSANKRQPIVDKFILILAINPNSICSIYSEGAVAINYQVRTWYRYFYEVVDYWRSNLNQRFIRGGWKLV